MRSLRSISLIVSMGLSACGGLEPDGYLTAITASDSQAIISGRPAAETSFPATGALITPVGLCTGTLIAPDVVLTAAHCVLDDSADSSDPNVYAIFTFDAEPGLRFSQGQMPSRSYKVARMVAHPSFGPGCSPPQNASEAAACEQIFSACSTGALACFKNVPKDTMRAARLYGLNDWHDVGLVYLESAVTDVTPAVLQTEDNAAVRTGASVSIVGYGMQTVDQDIATAGYKIEATTTLNEVSGTEVQLGGAAPSPTICHGDSGGPSYIDVHDGRLPTQRLLSIASRIYDIGRGCAFGGIGERVNANIPWITSELKAACDDGRRPACAGHSTLAGAVSGTDSGDGCDATPGSAWFIFALVFLARRRFHII